MSHQCHVLPSIVPQRNHTHEVTDVCGRALPPSSTRSLTTMRLPLSSSSSSSSKALLVLLLPPSFGVMTTAFFNTLCITVPAWILPPAPSLPPLSPPLVLGRGVLLEGARRLIEEDAFFLLDGDVGNEIAKLSAGA